MTDEEREGHHDGEEHERIEDREHERRRHQMKLAHSFGYSR